MTLQNIGSMFTLPVSYGWLMQILSNVIFFYFNESLTDSNDVYVKHKQGLILLLYLRYTWLYGN